MSVYFIQDVEQGYIKIGQSDDPKKRLKQLQTANPNELKLLWIDIAGDLAEEKMHKMFCEHRLVGEWFYPAKEIFEFIRQLYNDLSVMCNNMDISIEEWGCGSVAISANNDITVEFSQDGSVTVHTMFDPERITNGVYVFSCKQ